MFGKRSMDEAAGLTSLLTMVLLDETVYEAQRSALIEFTKVTPAKDAHELSLAVHGGLCDLAYKMWKEGNVPLGARGYLWKARQGEILPK
jgi:hypothetical protein